MAKKVFKSEEEIINTRVDMLVHDADELIIGPNSMKEDHLTGIRYAARFMRHKGLIEESEELLTECNIEQVPNYDIENSEFVQRLIAEGITPHIQGFLKMGQGKEAIRYPIVALNGDILRWEIFFQKLKHDLKQEMLNDSN